jgi:hypothetical protein
MMMTFAERHAQIDPDPVRELMRRRQMWAMAPEEAPDAQIVPLTTIDAAIQELLAYRLKAKEPGAYALYESYFDL